MTKEIDEAESIHTPREKLSKTILLFLAITIHNFPEGLAVGVAFGALASNPSPEAFIGAVGLAIGIGKISQKGLLFQSQSGRMENPVSMPFIGDLCQPSSSPSEPLGAVAVLSMTAILPLCPFFCGGAMIFVVVEELIPDSQTNGNTDVATLWSSWLALSL